jgi:hypothetical protein
MKIGDLVSYEWGYSNPKIQEIGIVLAIKQATIYENRLVDQPLDSVQFSFELLELDGKRNWYDVSSDETGPKVISSC